MSEERPKLDLMLTLHTGIPGEHLENLRSGNGPQIYLTSPPCSPAGPVFTPVVVPQASAPGPDPSTFLKHIFFALVLTKRAPVMRQMALGAPFEGPAAQFDEYYVLLLPAA